MARHAYVSLAVEGHLDELVLRKLLSVAAPSVGVRGVFGLRGKEFLRNNVARYNAAASYGPWFVLVDLNREAKCPPELIRRWLPRRCPRLLFRVAVHAVEAWLMADRRAFAAFLAVPAARIPILPESVPEPKRVVVDIARKSRDPGLRGALAPSSGSTARVGPDYNGRLAEFVTRVWSPARARRLSPSLHRAIIALDAIS